MNLVNKIEARIADALKNKESLRTYLTYDIQFLLSNLQISNQYEAVSSPMRLQIR